MLLEILVSIIQIIEDESFMFKNYVDWSAAIYVTGLNIKETSCWPTFILLFIWSQGGGNHYQADDMLKAFPNKSMQIVYGSPSSVGK